MKTSLPFCLVLACIVLFGAGCEQATISTSSPKNTPSEHADHAQHDADASAATSVNGRLRLHSKQPLPVGATNLRFTLLAENGSELTPSDLKVIHDRRLHLLLVRDDMTQFQHLHPQYEDGQWIATSTISKAGSYHLYFDMAPEKEAPVVLHQMLQIGGPTSRPTPPIPNAKQDAVDQGITATLSSNQMLKTGHPIQLGFLLTKDGQAVEEIAPYLGAFGHVVLLRHNGPNDFVHVHPVTETQPTDGRVIFETSFPRKGRYTLYAQFNVAGSVKTFPVTVDVAETMDTNTSDAAHSIHH